MKSLQLPDFEANFENAQMYTITSDCQIPQSFLKSIRGVAEPIKTTFEENS